jgi:penicillin-binding protein 1A
MTHDEYEKACAQPIVMVEHTHMHQYAPHAKEHLRGMLEKMIGKHELYTGGYVVQTTLDKTLQEQATNILRAQILRVREKKKIPIDGGLMSCSVKTGAIRAWVGGCDFSVSQFDRACQARVQLGSLFKLVVYGAALEQGATFADTLVDEPFSLKMPHGVVWEPHNFDRQFEGNMTRAHALIRSNNIVAIKTFLETGSENVATLGRSFGLKIPEPIYPSLALGALGVTVKEAMSLVNTFANQGLSVEPYFIEWVKDRNGKKSMVHRQESKRVLSARSAGALVKVLTTSFERSCERAGFRPCLGSAFSKTGTNNDCRVCWFAGATPALTTVVYIGQDDNKSMGSDVYPFKTAMPVWFSLYKARSGDDGSFAYDPSLRSIKIDPYWGITSIPLRPSIEIYV